MLDGLLRGFDFGEGLHMQMLFQNLFEWVKLYSMGMRESCFLADYGRWEGGRESRDFVAVFPNGPFEQFAGSLKVTGLWSGGWLGLRFEVLFFQKFVALGTEFDAHQRVDQDDEYFRGQFWVDAEIGEMLAVELGDDFSDADDRLLKIELSFPRTLHRHWEIKLPHLGTDLSLGQLLCSFDCIAELVHHTVKDAVVQKLAF
jgi:hypothetical protein